MENPVVENKKALRRMMARIWKIYLQLPPSKKRKAQRLIDEWFFGRRDYESLLEELRKLATGGKPGSKRS